MSTKSGHRAGVALVVGVGRYHSSDIQALQFAARDARALARLLANPSVCNFDPEQVTLLSDREGSRDQIVQRLSKWLPERSHGAEIALIYFACHGAQQRIGGNEEGYLLPYDTDPDNVAIRGIAMGEVAHWVNAIQSHAIVVILDCCHAGHLLSREATSTRSLLRDLSIRPAVYEKLSGRNRFLIASCDEGQKSIEPAELKHGLFTYYLLKGMKGEADRDRDGRVHVEELFSYVSTAVARVAWEKWQHKQHPWAKSTKTDDVLLSAPGRSHQTRDSRTLALEKLWKDLGPGQAMATLERQLRDQGEPWLRSVLEFLRRQRNPVAIPLLFHCLGHRSELIRGRAQKIVQSFGWPTIATACIQIVRDASDERRSERVGHLLDGLEAIEANPDVIRLLDDLVVQLIGALRTRAILLLERKQLSVGLEAVRGLFEARHSPYRIERVLGQGVFTAAYFATHEHTGAPVVIRVLRPSFVDDHRVRVSFLEVSKRAFPYVHQYLVRTLDVQAFADVRVYYTVRDYIQGVTLQDVLAQGKKFQPLQILEILRQALEALTPFHQTGTFHCGIKTSNLFLCDAERVRVILGDPGLAIPHHDLERLCYDYRYAAPEMFRGGGSLCPQSDFYSLGCVCYELLCGSPPFQSDNVFDLGSKHVSEPIPPVSGCGRQLGPAGEEFLNRLLAKAPSTRYRDIAETIQALEGVRHEIQAGSESVSRPVTILQHHSLMQFNPIQSVVALPMDSQPIIQPEYWSETCEKVANNTGADSQDAVPRADPTHIGRYRVIRPLGTGGFGSVFLARDDDLDRLVAIKVPNRERISGSATAEAYLAEGRALAKLDHPHIVPVYDVGRTADGDCYVVSKYIEGTDLAERVREGQPAFRVSAELVATVAEALHHAHTRGIVHRDVKPANILIDTLQCPWVADFGLALQDEDYGKGARLAGTPSYMSPEQARGEGHRVDGRSDIFSLSVVLYELLTGRKPFRGDTRLEVMDQITTAEPRPPRQIDDSIPRELERICLKALAKRASERYSTGRDMAEDLRHFLMTEPPTVGSSSPSTQEGTLGRPAQEGSNYDEPAIGVIPKGLRSFDRHDAGFYLELLPGPRDRQGLPEILRFWKTRIESDDLDTAFRVGLIYGPSGCGKSSVVKAGLLPRLGKSVRPVYVESTPKETEARLLRGLQKTCLDLPADVNIVDAMSALRRGRLVGPGQKVLVVLDEFEQWLSARSDEQNSGLIAALRQCDGVHVQAVIVVRDDFWMAATRFMRDLEIRLIEGENAAAVDLFDLLHARRVLAAFGRAYGALPEKLAELTPEQHAFLEGSVAGLAQDGKVMPVRLALFAEMVKGREWKPATLREVGGIHGLGEAFLEETFSTSTAPPEHRSHQAASQAVLRALLPPLGTEIKGHMRSESELRYISGYSSDPGAFDDLIRILDAELRLITPADPAEILDAPEGAEAEGSRFYQLTHDYLVQSVRGWLTRTQRATRRGRAELQLAAIAARWESEPENRNLPNLLEWGSIQLLTRRDQWSEPQRRMMSRAGRHHFVRGFTMALVLLLVGWAINKLRGG